MDKIETSDELSRYRTNLSMARSHMANERTHLSYFRTSLALMSFGITLNRFSIYLRENHTRPKIHNLLYETQYVGFGMVIFGIVILYWSLSRFKKVSQEIETYTFSSPQKQITILTIVLLLVGGFSAIWLLWNQV